MQLFSYHTHTNIFGFDGKNTAEEMIARAEEIGFKEIGISNHFIYHPNLHDKDNMFFTDLSAMEKTAAGIVESIRKAAEKSKIKVYAGFEVDFFPSARWCADFEKIRKNVGADYYIGSTHMLRDKEEKNICNMYHYYYKYEQRFKDDVLREYLSNYWQTVTEAVKSGYFDFIAHLDVYRIFRIFDHLHFDKEINTLIDAFGTYKTPFELNTSGWTKYGTQHPDDNLLKCLRDKDVPIVISDDAHSTSMLAQHFVRAEQLLKDLNYTNRWKLNK